MTEYGLYYLLEGFAIAFFGIMALQNLWHRHERLCEILGGILLYWMLQHLVSVVFTGYLFELRRDWSMPINAFDMTAEPTCCFLLMELCRPGWLTWPKVVVHELPFVILFSLFSITGHIIWYQVMIVYFMIYGVGIFVATLYYIPKYNKFLREHFSYDENVNLRWLYYVLITFFVLMFVYYICSSVDTVIGDCVYMAGSVISWSMICYSIGRQESVLFELKQTEQEAKEHSDLKEQAPGVLPMDFEKVINERFVEPQLYLRPQLKLGEMAEAIGTNRTYLSRYLNDTLHTTFYDYINALRLKHATHLIEKSEYSIQAIATLSGFNSYSTFRRTFIGKYGQSPQEYRINHR